MGDIDIDDLRLDQEWLRQPRLYLKYAEKLADSKRSLDEAKNELEVIRADVAKMIRTSPESFGLAKATEGAVAETMVRQDEVRAAERAVVEKKYEVQILEAAVQAIEHRKRALENLVSLHLAGYFSEPRATGESKEHVDRVEKQFARSRGIKNDE